MGGLITTLLVEQVPEAMDGGLAICSPIGDFVANIDYIGDFRVVFDYFFPGLMPGSPIDIPQTLIDDWENHYAANIVPIITDPGNSGLLDQLFTVTGAATDPNDPASREATVESLLWYNVFATNDAKTVLGGQPFDNLGRIYQGSADDSALNAGVTRFSSDPDAIQEIAANYETSGVLNRPLLIDHTTGDELVPFWNADLYADKILAAGSGAFFDRNSIDRYGHCNFTIDEILDDFLQLAELVDNPPPTPTPTNTPSATPTNTPTPTPNSTPTATETGTNTSTPESTPTATETGTSTPTPSPTFEISGWNYLPIAVKPDP